MLTLFVSVFLIANAAIYLWLAVSAWSSPVSWAKRLDMEITAPAGQPEFLATYMGLMLIISGWCLLPLLVHQLRVPVVLFLGLAYLGIWGGTPVWDVRC